MANSATFTRDSVTINGITQAAEYSVTPSGEVCMFIQADGKRARVMFDQDSEFYSAALSAAQAADKPFTIADLLDDDPQPEPEPMPEPEPKRECKPSVPKTQRPDMALWVDTSIKGKGWEIRFDGAYDRTRLMFKKPPCQAVKDLVKAHGFYWSPELKSWNKKLTCKAFRAAQQLAQDLGKIKL